MVLEQMMVGNPNESLKDLYQTLRTSRQVKADISAVSVYFTHTGTDLYDSLVRKTNF